MSRAPKQRRLGHEYDRLGVTWFEEPVSCDDLNGLAPAAHSLDVSAHCAPAPSLHAAPAMSIPNLRHVEFFHDHERVEGQLFDGGQSR